MLLFHSCAAPYATIQAENYSSQYGTETEQDGTIVTYFDGGDYLNYSGLNFGSPGTTTRILFRYSRNFDIGGVIELRIGGPTGESIGEVSFPDTGGWDIFEEVYVDIGNVDGIKDLSLVGVGPVGGWLGNIDWFKLAAPPAPIGGVAGGESRKWLV